MREYFLWVDILKVIGILAVILGHIDSPLGVFIFSWHMPFFFVLAGFFINTNLSAREFFLKDFKRLMIPYFIFSFVGLAVESIKRLLLHREGMDYIYELKSILFMMDEKSLMHHYGFLLWFLPALFVGRLAFYVLMRAHENIARKLGIANLWVYSLVSTLVVFACSFYVELPFGIDKGLNALLWIFIGFIFFKYKENNILYVFPLIGCVLYFSYGVPSMNMALKVYGDVMVNVFWALSVLSALYFFIKTVVPGCYAPNFITKAISMWGGAR